MNFYALLADSIIVIHVIYIGVVVFGQLGILLGWLLSWNWVRNPWFRGIHFGMILIVAVEAVVEFECPLTTWEYALRVEAGQLPANFRELDEYKVKDISFIGRNLQELMFIEPGSALQSSYYVFAAVVLGSLFLVPPRFARAVSASGLRVPFDGDPEKPVFLADDPKDDRIRLIE